jgi:hypothetical protein
MRANDEIATITALIEGLNTLLGIFRRGFDSIFDPDLNAKYLPI